jgi:hypothetical protein
MIRMKKFLPFCLLLFACGCLEVSQEIHVNKDGGGRIIERVMMSKAALKQLNAFFSSFPSDKKSKPEKVDIYDKKKLIADAKNYGPDVEYVSSKKLSTKTKDGYQVEYAFKDINTLRINQNPGDKGPNKSDSKSDNKEENVTFNFEKGSPSILTVNFQSLEKPSKEKKRKAGKTDKEAEQKTIDEMREILKDFYIGITVQPEGEIVETNATYREGNKITLLEMDFNKLLSDEKQLEIFAKKEPDTVEETKTLLKNLPGFKVEMNKKVLIKFE